MKSRTALLDGLNECVEACEAGACDVRKPQCHGWRVLPVPEGSECVLSRKAECVRK
jgi:hypothetical protein